MQLELKALQREVGITFVYVTHDQEEALTMSDLIVVMREGRIRAGRSAGAVDRPVTRFVADFIGTSNFLPASIERSANSHGNVVVRTGQRPHPARQDRRQPDARPVAGDSVIVATRPERLEVASAEGEVVPSTPG